MQAVRKAEQGRGHVVLDDVPEPRLEADEVLMRVWAAGICGSDLLIQDDKHFYEAPVTLGHEFSGVVAEIGPEVRQVRLSQKIVADIETRSGWLGVTRDGAFAPYMTCTSTTPASPSRSSPSCTPCRSATPSTPPTPW